MDAGEIRQFRQAVQDTFARELGFTFFPGVLIGPNQAGEWRGSCALVRIQEAPARPAEQQIFLRLRCFAPFSTQGTLSPNEPPDPGELEDMADKVLQVIARNQAGLGAWFQRITQIDIDPDTRGIEATVMAYSNNPGVPV
jgi:hypothetical protein